MPRVIHCPRCGKNTIYSADNPFRPFCSQRCQQIDLGAWADEKYRVPSESQAAENATNSEDPEEPEDEVPQ